MVRGGDGVISLRQAAGGDGCRAAADAGHAAVRPANGTSFSVNVTVPSFTVPWPGLVTVAMKVTDEPFVAYVVGIEDRVTVVANPLEGVMSTHQPPSEAVVVGVCVVPSLSTYSSQLPVAVAPSMEVSNVLVPAGPARENVPGGCGAGAPMGVPSAKLSVVKFAVGE